MTRRGKCVADAKTWGCGNIAGEQAQDIVRDGGGPPPGPNPPKEGREQAHHFDVPSALFVRDGWIVGLGIADIWGMSEIVFPPAGFVDKREAGKMFGVQPDTILMWVARGRIVGSKEVLDPRGNRKRIYSLEELQQLKEELAARRALPEGFVDRKEACEMFGVTVAAWVIWERQGKIRCGKWGRSRTYKPCKLYAVEDLLKLKDELMGEDKVYRLPGARGNEYHIPEGLIKLQDVCEMFGVNEKTWKRWEEEGLITFGQQHLGQGLKLYPAEEVKRVLAECGKYSPPYPDPERPGVYRVPLAGSDIHRREAMIDAEDLPLVEGKTFHYSVHEADHLGQVQTFNPGGTTRLRQIIMGVSGTDNRVGHRNGDPLDCRRSNLVVRTPSESNAAKRKGATFNGRPCTSRFKGVCFDKRRGKWVAYIKKDGVSKSLGRFDDELAAAEKYDEAARELFGEHARVNFPEGVDARLAAEAESGDSPSRAAA